MNGITFFFTPQGIVVAEGGAAGQALISKLEQAIATGEASGVAANFANDAAPIVGTYNDSQLVTDLTKSGIGGDWNNYTKEAFAAVLGTLAGIAALPAGPAASLAADMAMGEAFKNAYDAASNWSKNQDWGKLFDFIDKLGRLGFGDLFPGSDLSIPRNQRIPNGFQGARTPRPVDPLTLDLDGDGLETVGITADKQILFDHNGDGVKTGTGWVKGDDALLVLDKNGNGSIDNGNELFGVDTVLSNGQKAASGFAALADLDSNHDGVFSSADAQYANVQVWRDLDQDGISDAGELQTLAQAGIASINLTSTASTINFGNGNTQTASATYTRNDGTTGTAANLNLAANAFYREFGDHIALTAEAAKLPGLQGAGLVRDLQEAASLDAKLIQDVAALQGSRTEMLGQLDQLLQDWAGTANFKTSQQRAADKGFTLMFKVPGATDAELQAVQIIGQPGFDKTLTLMTLGVTEDRYYTVKAQVSEMGRMMGVLEAFNGQTFLNFGDDGTIKTGLDALVSTQSKDFSSINLASAGTETNTTPAVTSYTFVLPTLTTQQVDLLKQSYTALKESVYEGLVGQTRLKGYLDTIGLNIDASGISINFAALDAKLDSLYQTDAVRAFTDCLDLQKYVSGLSGMGWQGAAKLVAWSTDAAAHGTLDSLKAGLALAFATGSNGVPDIKIGTSGAETLSAGASNDIVIGQAGNDTLYGGAGSDILDGGTGNDYLSGDAGNDVYLFGRGSGQDTVYNYDTTVGKTDAIQFTAGIASTDVQVSRSGDSLVLNINGTADKLTVASYFNSDAAGPYKVEEIRFADGTVWNVDAVKAKALVPTSGNDTLYGYATADTISGGEGNDTISGYAGDDTLNGDSGGDYLYGGEGADTLNGGDGADYLTGDNGNDTLNGGTGNDTLYGNAGNDTLDGGVGNDYLSGDAGSDVYLFGRGSGQDTIYNYDTTAGKTDAIQFAAGITTTDVQVTRSGDSLVLSIVGAGDKLTVSSYFNGDAAGYYKVEEIRFADGTVWTVDTIKAKALVPTSGNDSLYGYATSDMINGGEGNDTISGYAGDDTLNGDSGGDYLYGGEGADTLNGGDGADYLSGDNGNDALNGGTGNDNLYGGAGNDVLDGGTGNDYLSGDAGNDVYLFGRGSGQDTVYNYDTTAGKTDAIQFAAGIASTDVQVSRSGDSLVLSINGTGDKLTVSSYFNSDATGYYKVEEVRFADGTVWTVDAIKAKALVSTSGNDNLYGYATSDTINGGEGNDTISGYAGDDTLNGDSGGDYLYGGEGADTLNGSDGADYLSGDNGNDALNGGTGNDNLYGGAGNDVLDGGTGNDYLSGDVGNDVYLFGRGSGQDTVYNYDTTAGKTDAIQFAAGIASTDVQVSRSGDSLVLSINGSADRLTVSNYFNSDATGYYKVEEVHFADGTVWTVDTIKAKAMLPTNGNDSLYGYTTADTLNGGEGNDTLYGYAGDDALDGGSGADYLYGGEGADTLNGSDGADYLTGDNGNDTLNGGTGNDNLYGGAGNDNFDGGAGNDYLSGGTGADVYLFGKGSGQDTIYNYDGEAVGTNADTIQLGTGIATTGVTLTRSSDNLIISINGTDDKLTVQSYFNTDGASSYVVENLRFADGTTWNYATVKSNLVTAMAPASITVSGTTANETLNGGLGNDTIYGNAGNDILDGGAGNDYLSGGTGADSYLFGKGSGQETIYNYDGEAVGTNADTILFAADLTPADITLNRSSDDLLVGIKGTTDSLRVQNYFYQDGTSSYVVENLHFADGTTWDIDTIKSKMLTASSENDTLIGYAAADSLSGLAGDDILYGRAGNDTLDGGTGEDQLFGEDGDDTLLGGAQYDRLWGGNGNDLLQGQDGDDSLYGEAGNDTIDGGAGNDYLSGGNGADTYLFGKGSGQDTVYNYDSDAIGTNADTVQFSPDLTTSDIILQRSSDDLLIGIKGTSDSLRIQNYFYQDGTYGYVLENLKFADGTTWDINTIKNKVLAASSENDTLTGYTTADSLSGLAGDDTLYGRAGNDTLDGGSGEDQLYGEDGDDLLQGGTQYDRLWGGNGNDVLQGQDGDDALYGQDGNDVLDGGAGNDTLDGGTGYDTYLFGLGSGNDTISAYDSTAGKLDIIQLGAGVAATNVALKREGDALVLSINDSGDSLRVSNYFTNDATYGYQVEQIKFADGTTWDINTVKNKVLTASSENDTLIGYATADSISGLAGDDTLYGRAGNDTLDAGSGEDILYGEDGDDTLLGGGQYDRLWGGNGNDLLQGQEGDDSLYGDAGNDIMQGGTGNDYLYDYSGTALFDGGSGNDTLYGGSAAEIFVGGSGNDTYTTGAGNDIVLFNKGDGQDTFASGGTGSDTISLGGSGLSYADLVLTKSANDLVLQVGATDQITFKDWYAATPSKPVTRLQVMAEAMAGFTQGGSDPLLDQKVENFNFSSLVGAFDTARAADSSLTSWALTNALTNFQLAGSDTAAMGGDLAYQYGKNGTLASIGVTPALSTLSDANLGTNPQALNSLANLQTGTVRLS